MTFQLFVLSVMASVVAYYVCRCLDVIGTLILGG